MTENIRNSKKLVAILPLCILALLFLASPSVHATPTCTASACNLHGFSIDFGPLGPDPCTGVPSNGADLILTGNLQSHASADGTHFTSTFEGDGTATLVTGVTAQIHVTNWDGGNLNPNNLQATGTGTFNFLAHLSDGSFVGLHGVFHITFNADGTVTTSFSTMSVTCG